LALLRDSFDKCHVPKRGLIQVVGRCGSIIPLEMWMLRHLPYQLWICLIVDPVDGLALLVFLNCVILLAYGCLPFARLALEMLEGAARPGPRDLDDSPGLLVLKQVSFALRVDSVGESS